MMSKPIRRKWKLFSVFLAALFSLAFWIGTANAATLSLPASLKIIESEAFMNNASISAVHIPKNITNIEENAFYGCNSITDVYFDGMITEQFAMASSAQDKIQSIHARYSGGGGNGGGNGW